MHFWESGLPPVCVCVCICRKGWSSLGLDTLVVRLTRHLGHGVGHEIGRGVDREVDGRPGAK